MGFPTRFEGKSTFWRELGVYWRSNGKDKTKGSAGIGGLSACIMGGTVELLFHVTPLQHLHGPARIFAGFGVSFFVFPIIFIPLFWLDRWDPARRDKRAASKPDLVDVR